MPPNRWSETEPFLLPVRSLYFPALQSPCVVRNHLGGARRSPSSAGTRKAMSVVDELLKSKEASIRWKTRVHILGEERDSKRIRALEEEGLHWVLASLADLGYPQGDETLYPIRDRILEFWLKPSYFHEFVARTSDEAYRHAGVPIMQGRYRRCASQQGNALYFLTDLGIVDERADSLSERLLHWQWPDGGWNCDKHPDADTSSFMETRLPMLGLAAYARYHKSVTLVKAVERASEIF